MPSDIRVFYCCHSSGVEHLIGNEEVEGSIPSDSTSPRIVMIERPVTFRTRNIPFRHLRTIGAPRKCRMPWTRCNVTDELVRVFGTDRPELLTAPGCRSAAVPDRSADCAAEARELPTGGAKDPAASSHAMSAHPQAHDLDYPCGARVARAAQRHGPCPPLRR